MGVLSNACTDFGGTPATVTAIGATDDDAGGLEGEVVAVRPSRRPPPLG
jgi:hypothetical protein